MAQQGELFPEPTVVVRASVTRSEPLSHLLESHLGKISDEEMIGCVGRRFSVSM
jgi:hypothetical protein